MHTLFQDDASVDRLPRTNVVQCRARPAWVTVLAKHGSEADHTMTKGWTRRICAGVCACLCAGVVGAQDHPRLPCAERDKACIARTVLTHPVRHLAFWQSARAQALDARVGPAP